MLGKPSKENQRRLLREILRNSGITDRGVNVVHHGVLGLRPQPDEALLLLVVQHPRRVLPRRSWTVTGNLGCGSSPLVCLSPGGDGTISVNPDVGLFHALGFEPGGRAALFQAEVSFAPRIMKHQSIAALVGRPGANQLLAGVDVGE